MDILAAPTDPKDILEYHLGQGMDNLTQLQANLFGQDGKACPPSKDVAFVEDVDVYELGCDLNLEGGQRHSA
jgi:hypothetical protein